MSQKLIQQCVKEIVIKPARKKPRKDWNGSFKQMRKLKEDKLLISDAVDLDMKEWEW